MQAIAYARTEDGVHIAYQVYGEPGGVDVVMVSGALFPMEVLPEDRQAQRLIDGLTQLGRLVIFDKRGVGMSDPYADWSRPSIEQWSDDLIATIKATALDRPLVFAWDLFGVGRYTASRRPDLVGQLVLFNPLHLIERELLSDAADQIQRQIADTDSTMELVAFASRADEPGFRDWLRRAGRLGASPATASRLWREMFGTDLSTIGEVTVPTLVIHRVDSMMPPDSVRHAVTSIPGAVLVELPGTDLYPISGDVDVGRRRGRRLRDRLGPAAGP